MGKKVIGALQIGSDPRGKRETLSNILAFEDEIISKKLSLLVLPEALLGGYPKGSIFGTYLGYRQPEGREEFARYYENSVSLDGPEVEALAGLSERTNCSLVIGAIERNGNTLYCSALFFDPQKGLEAVHRKLMPTGTERLVWGLGDGSTLPVVSTAAGKIGAAICWENHMPLLRAAMYAKGVQIWCAPTVDERDIWQSSMRHIAHEGRCFVISACQVQPSPKELGVDVPEWDPHRPLIRGGSVVVNPMGEVIAGPLVGTTGLVTAEIDISDLVQARYDLDVSGHYSRPDVFSLTVDETAKHNVNFISKSS